MRRDRQRSDGESRALSVMSIVSSSWPLAGRFGLAATLERRRVTANYHYIADRNAGRRTRHTQIRRVTGFKPSEDGVYVPQGRVGPEYLPGRARLVAPVLAVRPPGGATEGL